MQLIDTSQPIQSSPPQLTPNEHICYTHTNETDLNTITISYGNIYSTPTFTSQHQKDAFTKALTILEHKKYQNIIYEHKFYLSDYRFLTGLIPYLYLKLPQFKLKLQNFSPPTPIYTLPKFPNLTLRDYQENVVKTNLCYGRGINNLATGAGKTAIACATIMTLNLPTLFIVHTTQLATQTYEEFIKFGIPPSQLGLFYSQQKQLDKQIVIALIQSLNTSLYKKEIQSFLNSRQVLFIDETHHTPASSYMKIIKKCPAPYRFGLSGSIFTDITNPTPDDMRLMGATGNIIATISYQDLLQKGFLSPAICYFITPKKIPIPTSNSYTDTYKNTIVYNQNRNTLICQYAHDAYHDNQKVCIVVKHIEHGDILLKTLKQSFNIDAYFYLGNQQVKLFKNSEIKTFFQSDSFMPLSKFKEKDKFILILSPAFFEGIDIPSISVIIRADAGRSKKIDYQIIGRGLRLKPSPSTLTIIDFNDTYNYIFKHQSKTRLQTYSELGIPITYL